MNRLKDSSFAITIALHLSFIPFFLLAYWNYEERIYFEAASDIFYLLSNKEFYFVHNRYILIFSQWLPLLAIYLKFSLKAVLILLSIGNVLYFYGLFCFAYHYLKDRLAAIGILLTQSIVILYTFFNTPMAEIWFGAAMLLVLFSMFHQKKYQTIIDKILFITIIFLTVTSHPAILLITPFVFLYDFLENKTTHYKWWLITSIFMFLSYLSIDNYSSEALSGHYNPASGKYAEMLDFNYLRNFVFFLFYRYWALMLMLIFTISTLLYKRKFLLAGFITISFSGYCIIANVVAGIITNSNSGGLEIYYIPLVVIVGLPFLYSCYNWLSPIWKKIIFFLLIAAIFQRFLLINHTSNAYKRRTALIKRLIAYTYTLEGSKFYVTGENMVPLNPMDGWWTWPVESMILSAQNGKDKTVNIAPTALVYYERDLDAMNTQTFRWLFGESREYNYMNLDYFSLQNTLYHHINKNLPNDADAFNKISLKILDQHLKFDQYKDCGHICCDEEAEFISVEIQNKNHYPLYSGLENHLYISYYWLKDGKKIEYESILTPLEVDVINTYTQPVAIRSPYESGKYDLVVDLVIAPTILERDFRFKKLPLKTKTARWLDISQNIKVTIVN